MEKNNFYDELLKNVKGVVRTTPFTKSYIHDDNMARYFNFREKIFNNMTYLKIFLVFAIKEVTWKKELRDFFDCTPVEIGKLLAEMNRIGLVFNKQLISVDDLLFETIIKQNSNAFYGQRDRVMLYTLSDIGREFANALLENISEVISHRSDLQVFLQVLNERTQTHKLILSQIELEETSQYERLIRYPDGFIECKRTRKHKLLVSNAKQLTLQFRQQEVIGACQ